ncbi:MAG: hypothetical protein LBU32_33045 [Clostridiales bacterium]|nr:hypothetical protein [Clostridiales bacterium]
MANICPYCFSDFSPAASEFRCVNPRCVKSADIEATQFRTGYIGRTLPDESIMPRVMGPKYFKGLGSSAVCPECKIKSHKRVCPACHNPIPESTLTGKDMILSIVGSRNSGKTVFMGIIIEELRRRVLNSFGGAMWGFEDTAQRYDNGVYKKLYKELSMPELTVSALADTDENAHKPLIFTMSFRGFGQRLKTFTIVFFDTAGEDMNELDTMSTVTRYIAKSAGIIFLIDPLSLQGVRALLSDDDVKRSNSIDFNDQAGAGAVIAKVTQLIRNERRLSYTRKIDIPVAAVFSKLDPIERLFPNGSTTLRNSPHCSLQKFDRNDRQMVSDEIHSLLNEWGAGYFTTQLQTVYSNYSYFAVSSLGLGNAPDENKKIRTPHPHRVEDPLLWLLKENRVI